MSQFVNESNEKYNLLYCKNLQLEEELEKIKKQKDKEISENSK